MTKEIDLKDAREASIRDGLAGFSGGSAILQRDSSAKAGKIQPGRPVVLDRDSPAMVGKAERLGTAKVGKGPNGL